MFGCYYAGDGNATSNVQSVTGQTGSIAEGYSYDYTYGLGPDSYVDYITAMGGTIFYKSQDNLGRAVCYNGPSNDYRAIHSTVIFGALREGAFTKSMLMTQYANYLLETVDVNEFTEQAITQVSISPNPFSKLTNISLEVDSRQKSVVSVEIYDISGRLVKSYSPMPNALGSMHVSWDGRDDRGNTVSSGTYIVRIQTKNETVNKPVVFMK